MGVFLAPLIYGTDDQKYGGPGEILNLTKRRNPPQPLLFFQKKSAVDSLYTKRISFPLIL